MVSELRKFEDPLGPLGGPKISKSIIFSIERLKEFGTFPDRPISLRGRAARSRNRFECFRTTRRPKSFQIDHFLNRNLKNKEIWHLFGLADFFAFLSCRCHACDRCTKCWAIQPCEGLPGCELLVGFAAGIIVFCVSMCYPITS